MAKYECGLMESPIKWLFFVTNSITFYVSKCTKQFNLEIKPNYELQPLSYLPLALRPTHTRYMKLN